jgi:hypothetical protein
MIRGWAATAADDPDRGSNQAIRRPSSRRLTPSKEGRRRSLRRRTSRISSGEFFIRSGASGDPLPDPAGIDGTAGARRK